MDRRSFLTGALALGCAPAAMPLLTQATFAHIPGEARLVVIVLRGGLDGLDLVRPVGDPAWAALRPGAREGVDLGAGFALHPAAAALAGLFAAGELGFIHAVATPYRERRSHFDGQDLLEAGTAPDAPAGLRRSGWLNRLVAALPGAQAATAFGLGREALPILAGPAPVSAWSPDTRLRLGAQGRMLLSALYRGDAQFEEPAQMALALAQSLIDPPEGGEGGPLAEIDRFAAFAAGRLREETRIVALSLSGWDTHADQARALARPMARLVHLLLRLKAELGPLWARTGVLALTEFGRTVALNGSGGTDHGTGGVALLAGGALRGGRVLGRWPGLANPLDGRDLEPTADVRAAIGWALRGLFGLDRWLIEEALFPGLELGTDPGLLHG